MFDDPLSLSDYNYGFAIYVSTGLEPVELLVLFLPMPRTSRNQSQTHAEDDEEDFDLNVAGSDSENDVASSAPVLRRVVAQAVNDPEPRSKSSTAAHDVWHYFEKIKNDEGQIYQARCRVCKYVVPFQLSISLTSDACTGRIETPTLRAGTRK